MKTLIIAEAGVNHNGDPALACQLVDVAVDAGADIVKFQTFSADKLVTAYAPKAEYYNHTITADESQHAMLRRLELTDEMHVTLLTYCQTHGIEFLSTGFDIAGLDLLAGLGLQRFKIPSGEITNLPYLRHVGRYGKPIILSTGMSTLGEIESALNVMEEAGTPRSMITVLHCNTEYPTPMNDVNLRAMLTMRDAFGVAVGYSDHTLGVEVPVAAVALGAMVIEKHFTLDHTMPGPDHRASLEPAELKAMVTAIRNIEMAMGNGVKWPSSSEAKNKSVVRKSLVAACTIQSGQPFTEANLAVKRPGTGLSPMLWDTIVGRNAAHDYAPDDLIEL